MRELREWISIVISILALGISGYVAYETILNKKPVITFSERWDISQIAIFRGYMTMSPKGYSPLGFFPGRRVPINHLVYVVEFQSKGDKETDPIHVKFSNLSKVEITSNLLVRSPRLEWEPHTHRKPIFENETLKLDRLSAYNDYVRLLVTIRLEEKREITRKDIPYIDYVQSGEIHASRTNEPFEDGTIERLLERLNGQLRSLTKESEETAKVEK